VWASQAITPSITTGGSGCVVDDKLVVQGGLGAPLTLNVTGVSGGAVTGIEVKAPGLYSTFPTSPAVAYAPSNNACVGVTLGVTAAGASSANIAEATMGVIVTDQADDGSIENISIGPAAGGVSIINSTGSNDFTHEEAISHVTCDSVIIFCLNKGLGVDNLLASGITGYGAVNNDSAYGAVGVYINGQNVGSAPTGGNKFTDVNMLGFEVGYLSSKGQLDTFTASIADTIKFYGFFCDTCGEYRLNGVESTFTGPDSATGSGGEGVGLVVSDGTSVNANSLYTNENAVDVHVVGSSSLWIGRDTWSPSKTLSGDGSLVLPGAALLVANSPASSGGTGSTIYIGAVTSTDEGVAGTYTGYQGVINGFRIVTNNDPGAGQTFTVNLRINGVTRATCVLSGSSSFACAYTGPGINIAPSDNLDFQIVSSASANSAAFKGYVSVL
jgi:hypothetical protein